MYDVVPTLATDCQLAPSGDRWTTYPVAPVEPVHVRAICVADSAVADRFDGAVAVVGVAPPRVVASTTTENGDATPEAIARAR